jgi:protein-disulfide isomerase
MNNEELHTEARAPNSSPDRAPMAAAAGVAAAVIASSRMFVGSNVNPAGGQVESFAVPEVTADDHVLGRADAPVTVLEYGDYECPYCRGAARDVHRLIDRYPGTIRFVFRNFPVAQLHPHAEQAAEAAEAAAVQGKFWEMYELLLRPLSHLDFDSLLGYAERLELDTGRFSNEVMGNVHAARIERDVREGLRNGVNATPKFYVNGERIDGKFPLEGLVDAVRAAVTAAQLQNRST